MSALFIRVLIERGAIGNGKMKTFQLLMFASYEHERSEGQREILMIQVINVLIKRYCRSKIVC